MGSLLIKECAVKNLTLTASSGISISSTSSMIRLTTTTDILLGADKVGNNTGGKLWVKEAASGNGVYVNMSTDNSKTDWQKVAIAKDVTSLETRATSLETRATSLETTTGTANTNITSLQQRVSSLESKTFQYHIYAVFLNGVSDPSSYSVTNKYVFFTDIYTTKDPDTITTETIYSDLLSKMIWGTPMLRYNNPDSSYWYTNKKSGVLWNFYESYTMSAGGSDYTGPAFVFQGLGDEDSDIRIYPTVVDIKYKKVRVN